VADHPEEHPAGSPCRAEIDLVEALAADGVNGSASPGFQNQMAPLAWLSAQLTSVPSSMNRRRSGRRRSCRLP
jgi:hypothetical protein